MTDLTVKLELKTPAELLDEIIRLRKALQDIADMSKKTQIAKLILAMTRAELSALADDFVSTQSAAEDDGSEWRLKTIQDWRRFMQNWAKGLGSME